MKAVAIYPREQSVRVIDVGELPTVTSNQVLVRPISVGLCGTDREIYEQGFGSTPENSDYLILGHECLAEVLEVGSDVTRFSKGQLVVPRVRRPCSIRNCPACAMGRPDFCMTGKFTERGIVGQHGFLVERFVDEQQYFHAVPDELRSVGVLIEPLTIVEKSLIEIRDIQNRLPYIKHGQVKDGDLSGMTAVVLGAGPVGLLGAMALKNSGVNVYVYSRSEEPNKKAQLIEEAGIEYVSSDAVPPDQFLEITGNVDIIYEATGASAFAFEMIRLLGRNGVYVFTGVPGRKAPVPVDTSRIMADMVLKNQLLVGVVNAGPDAFESAIRTLGEIHRRWPTTVEGLITSRVGLESVEAFLEGKHGGIKTVVEF